MKTLQLFYFEDNSFWSDSEIAGVTGKLTKAPDGSHMYIIAKSIHPDFARQIADWWNVRIHDAKITLTIAY